jgi:hypothetical protein
MAEKIKENQFDAVGVNPFNAPVPGESLTSAPDMPRAWERPPQYTCSRYCYGSYLYGNNF